MFGILKAWPLVKHDGGRVLRLILHDEWREYQAICVGRTKAICHVIQSKFLALREAASQPGLVLVEAVQIAFTFDGVSTDLENIGSVSQFLSGWTG
jgi:hypothetical protein